MKLTNGLFALSLITTGLQMDAQTDQNIDYPDTKKVDTVTDYFGTEVKDPYRWLEDDRSEQTEQWVEAQNKVTFNYLDKIPYRNKLKDRLTELWNYEKLSAPFKEGDKIYFYKNDGLQNQSVLYRKDSEDGEAKVFLDPNKFSDDGTTSLAGMSFSEDGKTLAYAISEGGSDWRKIIVMNTETMELVGDTIRDVKFSGLSWKANDGFYYSRWRGQSISGPQ